MSAADFRSNQVMASIITPCVAARLDAVFKVLVRTGEEQPICDRDALPSRWRTSRSLHKSCEGASQRTGTPIIQPPEKAARGAGIDRARSGYRKHAARVLHSRHRPRWLILWVG